MKRNLRCSSLFILHPSAFSLTPNRLIPSHFVSPGMGNPDSRSKSRFVGEKVALTVRASLADALAPTTGFAFLIIANTTLKEDASILTERAARKCIHP